MKRLLAGLLALAALTAVGRASADPLRYGVADDWPKFHACGDVWWQSARDIGYQDMRLTVQWDETTPTVIPYEANIKAAVDCAALAGMRPILAVYPLRAAAIGSDSARQDAFAMFAGLVAQAFPPVSNIIVGNEPNVNRFWQPQFVSGTDFAAHDYLVTLLKADGYIRAVRPDVRIWGPAISSRGNDNATAQSNPSQSPVKFIADLGKAYRLIKPTVAAFDEFDMHPYPPTQDDDPFSKSFQWPQAGAADLNRIKQALYDAFHGTAQPVPAEQPGGQTAQYAGQGLPINLDEAGEQTVITGHDGAYNEPPENVKAIAPISQAARHVELAEIAACDPDVKSVFYFPLIDNTSLSGGFQSGNLYADLTHKASYDGLKQKFASAKGSCQGGVAGVPQGWAHATGVIGAAPIFGGPGTDVGSNQPDHPTGTRSISVGATASEDANYTATLYRADHIAQRSASGVVKAYFKPAITFDTGTLSGNSYYVTIQMTAALTAGLPTARTSSVFKSNVFKIGGASTPTVVVIASTGSLVSLFVPPPGGYTITPNTPSLFAVVTDIGDQLGPALVSGVVNLFFLIDTRALQSARAKLPTYKIRMVKGKKLVIPKFKKLPPGRYKLRLAFAAATGARATLTTPAFQVDTKGKLSFNKAAAAKKPKPKPKPKKK